MNKTRNAAATAIAALALGFGITGCDPSTHAETDGMRIGSDTANPEKVEEYRRVIAEDAAGFTVQELTPWEQPERDDTGLPYIPKNRLLPPEITVASGETLTADAACHAVGGQIMLSDPPMCTVDIPVADSVVVQPEPMTDAAPSEKLEDLAGVLREARR